MRILSKFKDYYDGAQAYGVDKELVYVRETKIIQGDDKIFSENYKNLRFGNSYLSPRLTSLSATGGLPVSRTYIFFCGGVSVLYKFRAQHGTETHFTDPGALLEGILSGELANRDLESYTKSFNDKMTTIATYQTKDSQVRWVKEATNLVARKPNSWEPYPFNAQGWERYLERVGGLHVKTSDVTHLAFNSPVVAYGDSITRRDTFITVNPNLGDFGFFKIFDPHRTFQEISMYLGNNLARQVDPVPVRTQELIRDAHGFNDVSFRGPSPGEKERRRKANKDKKAKGSQSPA